MNRKQITDLTCRVCLNIEELMVNIYEECEDFQTNLVELLEACGGLVVDRSDNLPQYLCNVCAEELLVAAKFREKCAKSMEVFSQLVIKVEEAEPVRTTPVAFIFKDTFEDLSYDQMSEEILNEIIIEEAEEASPLQVEWTNVEDGETNCENIIECDKLPYVTETVEEVGFKDESQHDDGPDTDFVLFNRCREQISEEPILESEIDNLTTELSLSSESTSTVIVQQEPSKKKLPEALPLKFHCDECGAAFSSPHNLNRHLKTHLEFAEKLHCCTVCRHSFTKLESLQAHCENNHQNDENETKFRPKVKTGTNTCEYCGKLCASKASLLAHIRTHTGDRPFPCTECPKSFKTQAALSLHLKRHAGQFDWECEVCGKRFVESSNLRIHMRTHTGEKPHLCKVCGRQFARVFLLQLHMRSHTGEKPYKCGFCDKAYSQKCDLDIHVRAHTGARPHVCQICFRGFVKSHTLQKHMQHHQKNGDSFPISI